MAKAHEKLVLLNWIFWQRIRIATICTAWCAVWCLKTRN